MTTMEQTNNRLLKRFHTLCGKIGINADEKAEIVASYGVESSKDINTYELLELCDKLEKLANPELADLDKWRKRVIAAVAAYLKAMRYETNISVIKATACRAAKAPTFNKIPLERLKSLYNAFKNRTIDLEEVDKMTEEFVLGKSTPNTPSC